MSQITTKEIAAVLLSSKGRSASVSVDDSGPVPLSMSVANRHLRSVSNQIEEDAVNGLLVDLLSPMAEERRARVVSPPPPPPPPAEQQEARPEEKKDEPATDEPVVESSAPEPSVSLVVKSPNDGSDSGVSDSSDSDEGSFFPDNVGSPKLGRSSGRIASPTSAAALLRQLRPPPATLEPQASVLSWRDYLRAECPVCQELSDINSKPGKDASVCNPCGALVCKSCVMVFKQKDQKLFVRVCRKCRNKVPSDGEMVCGACCSVVLGPDEETRTCTECNRTTCFNCCRLYFLKSLGEAEPRAVCSACVSEVQSKLSAYPRLDISAIKKEHQQDQQQAPPEQLERKSSGSFWKALKSPRRTPEQSLAGSPLSSSPSAASLSSSPRRPGIGGKKTPRKSLGARDSVPFPGVKLHVQVVAQPGSRGSGAEVPESIAVRKVSRPVPLSKVTFGSDPALPTTASSPRRTGLVISDFDGDSNLGQLPLKCGQFVSVKEDREDGWAFGCESSTPERSGLFRLDCVTFDAAQIAAAEAVAIEKSAQGKYALGSFVRIMIGFYWTECEVTREGNSRLPYELRTLDAAKTVVEAEESALMPSLRPTLDTVDQQRKTPRDDSAAVLTRKSEQDEAAVLDSLKNRVIQMQQQRVGSASSMDKLVSSSESISAVASVEGSAIEEVAPEEESERSMMHRLGKALIAAVRENHTGNVLKALDDGADPNFNSGTAGTALLIAAKLGFMKLVLLLLQRGANACAQTGSGWTALHFAAKSGNKEMAELLLAYGARNDMVNEWMKAPIDLARERNDAELVELLRKPPSSRRNSKAPVLSRVSKQENASSSTVKETTGLGSPRSDSVPPPAFSPTPPPQVVSGSIATASSSSVVEEEGPKSPKSPELVRVVAQETKVVTSTESIQHSPIYDVQASKSPEPVRRPPEAIQHSPPARRPVSTELTAEHVRAVAVPLEARFTPLPASPIVSRHPPAASEPLNRIPGTGTTPASPPRVPVDTTAAQPFRDGPTKSVIIARPKAKQKNPNRHSKSLDLTRHLVEAAVHGDVGRMKSLVGQGAKVNGVDPTSGHTPLIAAVLACQNEAIMFLLDQPDINVNKPNVSGSTVLHVLAETGNEDAAIWLIRRGANVNLKNSKGVTPLQLSAKLSDMVSSGAALE